MCRDGEEGWEFRFSVHASEEISQQLRKEEDVSGLV